MEFLSEFWSYIRTRKKYWLAPLLVVCLLFGGLIIAAKGSVVAPFIYALF